MKNLAPKIQHLTFLVTRDSEVQNVADLAVSMNAKLDVIYNNADVSSDVDPRILSTTGDEFKRVVDVNLFGAFSELNMQPG
jgi:NAD(P)-dependent dehydrogenase (short-subunit alcohol dehydrogenase family)